MEPEAENNNGEFLRLAVKADADASDVEETLTGVPLLEAGKSYTYNLTVGKNKLQIASVTVADWSTGEVLNGKAKLVPKVEDNTITLYKGGTLSADVLAKACGTGYDITIVGPMNDADFDVLKSYLDGLNITADSGTPVNLDLSEAEVKTIPDAAFYECKYGLGNVALPKSVETIEGSAFSECKKLQITNWEQLTKLTSIGECAFLESALGGNVVLPNSVTELGRGAYDGTKITSISLPDDVTLYPGAFYECGNLQTITFRGDVEFSYVDCQFENCAALTTIDFSHCTIVPNINDRDAFGNIDCSKVTLYVPKGMVEEFKNKGWTDFKISETIQLTSVGTLTDAMITEALNGGHALKITGPMDNTDFTTLKGNLSGLKIAESGTPIDLDLSEAEVTKTPTNAFKGTSIGYYTLGNVALPKSIEIIGSNAFNYCMKLNITNLEQLEHLEWIGNYAFDTCSALTGNVVLSSQLSSVGDRAFTSTDITSITFPDGVELQSAVSFSCQKLEKIIFQGNVTFNGSWGGETNGVYKQFAACASLKTFDFSHCTTVPNIKVDNTDNDAFKDVDRSKVTLMVPAGMTEEFRNNGWDGFNIVEQ